MSRSYNKTAANGTEQSVMTEYRFTSAFVSMLQVWRST
jgi:hypothetical protein